MSRRKISSKYKTKVVMESLSKRYTLSELAERHKLQPNQISSWKSQFLANDVFKKSKKKSKKSEAVADRD